MNQSSAEHLNPTKIISQLNVSLFDYKEKSKMEIIEELLNEQHVVLDSDLEYDFDDEPLRLRVVARIHQTVQLVKCMPSMPIETSKMLKDYRDQYPCVLVECLDGNNITYRIILLDEYSSLQLDTGNIVHLYEVPTIHTLKWTIFRRTLQNIGFIICEPEIKISPTQLAKNDYCQRQAVLNEQFQQYGYTTKKEFYYGNVGHALFEMLIGNLNQQIYDELPQLIRLQQQTEIELHEYPTEYKLLIEQIDKKLIREAHYLYFSSSHLQQKDMMKNTLSVNINVIQWIKEHIKEKKAICYDGQDKQKNRIIIEEAVQCEQRFESNVFGLVGSVDVVLRVQIQIGQQPSFECKVPLELKTGKTNDSHKMQVRIYMLMMRQHYQSDVVIGLLLSLKDNSMSVLQWNLNEETELLLHRNIFAIQLVQTRQNIVKLPRISVRPTQCVQCEQLYACQTMNLLNDLEDLDERYVSHSEIQLKQGKCKDYLNTMLTALRFEESTMLINNQSSLIFTQLWTPGIESENIRLYSRFMTYNQCKEIQNRFSIGERIILTSDKVNRISLNINDIYIRQPEIHGGISYLLYSLELYQLYIDTKCSKQVQLMLQQKFLDETQIQWQCNVSQYNNYKQLKQVLINLTLLQVHSRMKDMIILGLEPSSTPIPCEDARLQALDILNHKFKNLNKDQKLAIEKCLFANDYALILGYPGTGKTFTLVHLLYLLQYIGKKVLICSYTNNAVDNILDCFYKHFPNQFQHCIRFTGTDTIGKRAKTISFNYEQYSSIEQVEQALANKSLYFTTSSSQNHAILMQQFDYCIIDEASQMIEPLCIANILNSKVFILIGDYKQLQPIVKHPQATILHTSLLEKLHKNCPQSAAQLTIQFRMNQQIMILANTLIYDNKLSIQDMNITYQ